MSMTIKDLNMIGDEAMFLAESNAIENVFDEDSLIQAFYAWKYLKTEKELDHGVILKAHKILMNHQKIRPDERGYYRQRNVAIVKEKIVGIDPDNNKLIVMKEKVRDLLSHKKIREEMSQWIVNANDLVVNGKNESFAFLEKNIQRHHVNFETIHPFIDGNGRIGRMLLNWQRLQLLMPVLIISADPDKKRAYYDWFK